MRIVAARGIASHTASRCDCRTPMLLGSISPNTMIVTSAPTAKAPAAVACPACCISRLMIEPIVKNDRFMSRFQKSTAVSSRSGSSSRWAIVCCALEPWENSLRWALQSENMAASLAEKKAEQSSKIAIVSKLESNITEGRWAGKLTNSKYEIRNRKQIQMPKPE